MTVTRLNANRERVQKLTGPQLITGLGVDTLPQSGIRVIHAQLPLLTVARLPSVIISTFAVELSRILVLHTLLQLGALAGLRQSTGRKSAIKLAVTEQLFGLIIFGRADHPWGWLTAGKFSSIGTALILLVALPKLRTTVGEASFRIWFASTS